MIPKSHAIRFIGFARSHNALGGNSLRMSTTDSQIRTSSIISESKTLKPSLKPNYPIGPNSSPTSAKPLEPIRRTVSLPLRNSFGLSFPTLSSNHAFSIKAKPRSVQASYGGTPDHSREKPIEIHYGGSKRDDVVYSNRYIDYDPLSPTISLVSCSEASEPRSPTFSIVAPPESTSEPPSPKLPTAALSESATMLRGRWQTRMTQGHNG